MKKELPTELDRKIKSLEKELEQLKLERDTNSGIKPSETRSLIEKYYGHCFRFEGEEYGSIEMILESIWVDREKRDIKLVGNFICYVTPDCSFLSDFSCGLTPYGGSIICTGSISTDHIPYFPDFDWDEHISDELDKYLSSIEISLEHFSECVENVDIYANDIDYLTPLNEIIEEKRKGYCYNYNYIFGKL